ncbi:MAG: PEP/pyruvate-binding domain-containing protein [Planctomycetota bacterium]
MAPGEVHGEAQDENHRERPAEAAPHEHVAPGAGQRRSESIDEGDADDEGPSLCDESNDSERTITRSLRRVWSSLWNFRAVEEREYFQIPQQSAAMGVLFTRAFRDELANGVVFTGDPATRRQGCYVVTAQVGDASVVRPDPDVLPEINVLEVSEDGDVLGILRAQRSTLLSPGEFVLDDEQLRELGEVIAHVDANYPIELGDRRRSEVLLDIEFKITAEGQLALKQARPFLMDGVPRPALRVVVPEGTEVCAGLSLTAPSADPRVEYEAKSLIRFRAGEYTIDPNRCVARADLLEEFVQGPDRTVALPIAPGFFRIENRDEPGGGETHRVDYHQEFRTSDGRQFELAIFNLPFRSTDGVALVGERIFDERFLTFELTMFAFGRNPPQTIRLAPCEHRLLPKWDVDAHLSDGNRLRIREHFLPPEDLNRTGPASVQAVEFIAGDTRRFETEYWNLVYSSGRHNVGVKYWAIFSSPLRLEGMEKTSTASSSSLPSTLSLGTNRKRPRLPTSVAISSDCRPLA